MAAGLSCRLATVIAVLLAVVSCSAAGRERRVEPPATREAAPARVDEARLARADSEPYNWYATNRGTAEDHYSPLVQINESNVRSLGFAWEYATGTARGLEASPLVIDGVMYTSGNWGKVYALEAKTGKGLWTYDPEVPGK